MLSSGLVNNLDNLAREGIIDFDAAAFITGTKPRYVGNPSYAPLPIPEMPGVDTSNLKQPSTDEMIYTETRKNGIVSKNPMWKKVLFGVLTGGLLIAGGRILYKSKLFKNFGSSMKNTVTGLFKKKPAVKP